MLGILAVALAIGFMAIMHAILSRGSWTGIDVSDRSWPMRKLMIWWYRLDDK